MKTTKCDLESSLVIFDEQIKKIFQYSDLEKIHEAASSALSETDHKWFSRSLKSFIKGCPTSAYLVIEQLKRGKDMELKDVFKMELIMSMGCVNFGEFQEGVRALLIDKDNEPNWSPSSLKDVSSETIEKHFKSTYNPHPLEHL